MPTPEGPVDDAIHSLKNHLAVIVGYCDLLLLECPADEPWREDLLEVQKAAHQAMAVLPELVKRNA